MPERLSENFKMEIGKVRTLGRIDFKIVFDEEWMSDTIGKL